MSENGEAREESKIRKFIFNEVTAVIALISLTVGVVSWIKSPSDTLITKVALIEQRLETIEGNHLTHIQDSMEKMETRVGSMEQNIAAILAILNEK